MLCRAFRASSTQHALEKFNLADIGEGIAEVWNIAHCLFMTISFIHAFYGADLPAACGECLPTEGCQGVKGCQVVCVRRKLKAHPCY